MRDNLIFLLILFALFTSACIKNEDNIEYDRANPGTVKDTSGNIYPTVKIGKQVWMAENLRTTKYRDGSDIQVQADNIEWGNFNYINNTNTTIPMMCWYNNDQKTFTENKFGALYNWYAINPSTNGRKDICPTGWHVPTDAEWSTLITFLGGEYVAGGKMKSTGTGYWETPNTAASDTLGFSGLPGGYRGEDGKFYNFGKEAHLWSITEQFTNKSWVRQLYYYGEGVSRSTAGKSFGLSVRCIMD